CEIYRGDVARTLYGECRTDGFMFDIEIILRARQQGYRIREFPIAWTADPDSRLSVTRTSRTVLTELWAIKRSLAAS
ncbi:MAG: glycosyltransferase family 2 protein, partial [Candidatus Marinimicrobia bacterium]|nr:glycosyltransferase family 2 protein [Candidatus Neomarinimicrobiota bacterium]